MTIQAVTLFYTHTHTHGHTLHHYKVRNIWHFPGFFNDFNSKILKSFKKPVKCQIFWTNPHQNCDLLPDRFKMPP